jgi:CRP-like cAMP-binding protein
MPGSHVANATYNNRFLGEEKMVSIELLRRYPFFAGLSREQMTLLSKAGSEEKVKAGHFFLHEKDETYYLYLVIEGKVSAVVELPGRDKEIVIGTVGPGDVFAWSALVPPHTATASVKALEPCHVVAIDCRPLLEAFEDDPRFGYQMMMKVAQLTRNRVNTMTTEVLAYLAEESGV